MGIREKTALKNMKYNRFILLRYSLALFFFANLNWFIFMLPSRTIAMGIPLALALFALIPANEFIKLYSKSDNTQLNRVKPYFIVQLVFNLVLGAVLFNQTIFRVLFPFLNANVYGMSGALGIVLSGAVIAFFCVRKAKAISKNKDIGYKHFSNFKKSLKVSEAHGK